MSVETRTHAVASSSSYGKTDQAELKQTQFIVADSW